MQKPTKEHWKSSTLAARAIEPTVSSCIDENYCCYELDASFFFARHWTTQVEYAWKTISHATVSSAEQWTNKRNKQTNLLSFRRFSDCYFALFFVLNHLRVKFSLFTISFVFLFLVKRCIPRAYTIRLKYILLYWLWKSKFNITINERGCTDSLFFSWTFQHIHNMQYNMKIKGLFKWVARVNKWFTFSQI